MGTVSDILIQTTRLAFVALGVLSIVDYVRYRDRIRRDVALMFGVLAATVVIQIADDVLNLPVTLLSVLGSLALVAHPYLMLRLVDYFRHVPSSVRKGALAGLVASWIIVAISRSEPPSGLSLAMVLYFVVVEGYAMIAFAQGALTASGVVQKRLRFIAAGSGLLASIILLIGIGIVLPQSSPLTTPLAQIMGISSAVTYYLGLAPPRWLLGFWQLSDLKQFLSQLSKGDSYRTSIDLYRLVCHAALQVTGGRIANVVLWSDTKARCISCAPGSDSNDCAFEPADIIIDYLGTSTAVAVEAKSLSSAARTCLQMDTAVLIYFVPLERNKKTRATLLVLLEHGSLFVDDDLNLLRLFAEQAAVVLENVNLIEELNQHTELLEVNVQQRTAELKQRTAHLNLLQAVTVAANEATSIDEPFQKAVNLICTGTNIPVGHVFAPTEDAPVTITSRSIWYLKDPEKYARFQAVTEETSFSPESDCAGYVLTKGEPLWLTQITENSIFQRSEAASAAGLKTGIFVPVFSDKETVAVLEFFSDKDWQSDNDLLELLVNIGTQLGRVIERKRTELALLQSEVRFRALFESAPAGIVMIDPNGYIVMVNEKFVEMFGYQQAELVDEHLEILLPEQLRATHIEHRKNYFTTPQSRPMGVGLDLIGRRKDSTEFPIEVGLSYIETVEGMRAVGFVNDISEQKRAQEALLESEGRYHRIVDNMMEGFQLIGFDWRYLYLNHAAAQHGRYPREELIGNKITEKYPGIENSEMFAALRYCMEERVAQQIENEFIYPDGSSAWFELSIQPIPEGIFILSLDITERKEAEAAMQQLNEELEQRVKERTANLAAVNRELEAFSYSVSHDLRAPLRAVDGFSLALLEDFYDMLNDEGKEYLNLIRAESQRMGQLIDDLIDLSRYTRTEFKRESVDLSRMARSIAVDLRRLDSQRKVEFVIEDGIFASADSDLIQVALRNLFENAWKYTSKEEQARIEFGTMQENGQTSYFVRDNGVGFDMKYAHKLFGAFQRLHTKSEFEGSGIGLATVRRIIHRHSGTVRVESAVNKGATFFFTLETGSDVE